MKYIKLFEDFKVEDIPQTEPQFTQWIIKNAPKSFTNPQEWFEEEMAKREPNYSYIGFIIKELGLANRLSIPKSESEDLERKGWHKEQVNLFSLLHWAVYFGLTELTKVLIEGGVKLDVQDWSERTPLHFAIFKGYTELAKMLIEAGADLNVMDINQYTPLYWAAMYNIIEIAKMLIEAGADLNAEDSKGRTPLHWAARNGHPEIAKMLIDAGADVNAENEDKQTPLHLAADENSIQIAKMLIDAGANVNAKNSDKWTPWDYANSQMCQALPELNPNRESL
jgi:ankyrin repeat protein